ncbi:class I SAM-dependent methyltransferase [Cellulomonas sp. ATA003]|uniref:class I SAM-dependent methyltransferase n=1 Tax=Cellulomonas sp. ATA003 TaxID=3073064 RepID=UPI002872D634|nr:class I SAM-dependent methyltransferase [Cellulomonas sp. ATA003]WNB87540.1 class I SAM-dependent methyltransferase [Cellulomonas sp. ATA003]
MNRAETMLVNNRGRAWLQRSYEVPLLQRLGARLAGADVVEIGCGRGVGTELLLERWGVAHVTALDLDPAMVDRARRRLARHGGRVDVRIGDACDLPFGDASIDAVVDFGVIHHVPAWRDAVAETARVLRPGAQFVFEEVTRHALERWSYRTFLEHPEHDRFSAEEFIAELEQHGFVLPEPAVTRFFGDFVIGVAVKPATTPRGPL